MNLENKTKTRNPNIFKRIVRRAMPYIFAAGLGLAIVGCKESPGPISVQNIITPSSVPSDSYIYWEVRVTNSGGKVTINSASAHERVVSGWAAGKENSVYLPISNTEISPHSTETIFSYNAYVWNHPPSDTPSNLWDITLDNTVTVNSDGGSNSDTCSYTIRSSIYSFLQKGNLKAEKNIQKQKVELLGHCLIT